MTQAMNLNKMGLVPMNYLEMYEVDGGGLIDDIGKWALKKALDFAWDHRQDIADGLAAFAEGARDGSQTSGGIFYK